MWEGVYHRALPTRVWVPTAAIVVEILSPDGETYEIFAFYASRGVGELIIADPVGSRIRCWRLDGEAYSEVSASRLLGIDVDELTALIDWP